jgi:hypothetical protein
MITKKRAALAVAAFLLVGIAVYLTARPTSTLTDYTTKAQTYFQDEQAKAAALAELYKQDTYGGATPEETLALYIAALEKGDIETAVNLFAVEDRGAAKSSFARAKFMSLYVEYLKLPHKIEQGAVPLDTPDVSLLFFKGQEQVHVEDFKINPFSKKWKIIKIKK